MNNALAARTPLQLRAELEGMVLKDPLGPAGGPTEIVEEGQEERRGRGDIDDIDRAVVSKTLYNGRNSDTWGQVC